MKTIGIIAEYNPFHNGHQYQIEEAKKRTGAKNVVIIMSGDFVQRGTPAWTDKYLRTRMALSSGADIVFELPVCFAAASAEYFASAGVSLLTKTGIADAVCFGAECADLDALKVLADAFCSPSERLNSQIHSLVKKGLSFPSAREESIRTYIPDIFSKYPDILSAPNNILAIEYLKAVKMQNSPLIPVMIKRTDSGYHESAIPVHSHFASSTAIRALSQEKSSAEFLKAAKNILPDNVIKALTRCPGRYSVTIEDFSELIYYRLLHLTKKDMDILDMSEEIYYRIKQKLPLFSSVSEFTNQLKTRQYTYSRIARVLLHLLLDIKKPFSSAPCYARLLGFRREKSALLRQITGFPIITKPADGLHLQELCQEAKTMYEKDLETSNLYKQIQKKKLLQLTESKEDSSITQILLENNPFIQNELFQKPVIL